MNDTARSAARAQAFSLDGRLFQFDGSIESPFDPGSFVTIASVDGHVRVGQIDDVSLAEDPTLLSGSGRVLGVIDATGSLDDATLPPFSGALVSQADAHTVRLVFGAAGASLGVGRLMSSSGIAGNLVPHRFNRHTFWCGQSGSGKTYALGVLLEQLLIHTELPMVIFDPNSDFVRLREPGCAAQSGSEESSILGSRDIRVLRPGGADGASLRVRFRTLSMPAKAAVLRLDPLEDRAEYNALMHAEEQVGSLDPGQVVPALLGRNTESATALAARVENLRLVDWSIWAGSHAAATEIIDTRPDATVLDLGGLAHPEEHLVVAMAVLDDLWAKRESRRPALIVIDEAHNLCSPDGDGPLQRAVRERIAQIAAEGRKFGLWLLLSTQRPSKIPPGVISQCDNLAVMKMSSSIDLAELGAIFGFAPPAMLARAPRFRQGEMLFAGGFVPAPMMVSVRERLTREGGVDVPVPMRN